MANLIPQHHQSQRKSVDTAALRRDREALVAALGDAGASIRGKDFRCPFCDDAHPSAGIFNGEDGGWRFKCHGKCGFAGDIIDVRAKHRNVTPTDIIRELAAKSNGKGNHRQNGNGRTYASAQDTAEAIRRQLGQQRDREYGLIRDDAYSDDFHVLRLEPVGGGKKECRPIWCDAARRWHVGDPPAQPLPIFNRQAVLAADVVIVVEGEPKVEAFASVDCVATTTAHGADQSHRSDLSPLKGKRIYLCLDNDAAGKRYGEAITSKLREQDPNADIRMLVLPGLGESEDVVDWLAKLDSVETEAIHQQIVGLLAAAPPAPRAGDETVSLTEFLSGDDDPCPPAIEGLIYPCQVGVVASSSKAHKTLLMMGLAVCTTLGKPWLDSFPTTLGRVLYVDLELSARDIRRRMRAIIRAMYAAEAEVGRALDVKSCRAKVATIDELEPQLMRIVPGTYAVIIIDSLYMLYPPDFEENSNSQMKGLVIRLIKIAEHLRCALLVVHHSPKGNVAERRAVDVAAGAGALGRAADLLIAIREHETPDCAVLEATPRSFRRPAPIAIRWQYPMWQRDLTLDPAKLARPGKGKRAPADDDVSADAAKPVAMTVDLFVETFVTDEPADRNAIVGRARLSGLAVNQITSLIAVAEAERKVCRWKFPRNRSTYLATRPQTVIESIAKGAE